MSFAIILLMVCMAIWMGICAWCGYTLRLIRFLAVLVAGLALYMVWIVIVVRTTPLDPSAVAALVSGLLYASSAFGVGYLVGRIARQFKASRVDG